MKCLAGYKCTEEHDLKRALALLNPTGDSLFIDIGSGEGQVLLFTASLFGCQCLGLENDGALVNVSAKAISNSLYDVSSRISILEEDAETFAYNEACRNYTSVVIYMFLSHFGYAAMGKALLERCPVDTRVVTVSNPIDHPLWIPKCVWLGDKSAPSGTLNLYFYVIDEKMKESSRQLSTTVRLSSNPSRKKRVQCEWIHPPPGSYLPRSVPNNTPEFPSSCTADKIHAYLTSVNNKDQTISAFENMRPLDDSIPISSSAISTSPTSMHTVTSGDSTTSVVIDPALSTVAKATRRRMKPQPPRPPPLPSL